MEKDLRSSSIGLWAKVADFGRAHAIAASATQSAGSELADQHACAWALWECLTWPGRAGVSKELMPGWLHAVLGQALMADPGQRWADMTALVGALERGRATTAALTEPPTAPERVAVSLLLERALAHAEDGLFASACQLWRELHEVLAGHDAELGRSGFVVGAALFNAARAATGAARRRGLRRCVDVLGDAISSLESSNDLETTHEARLLAARACEEWMNTYPTSSTEHHQLERLAEAFRTQA